MGMSRGITSLFFLIPFCIFSIAYKSKTDVLPLTTIKQLVATNADKELKIEKVYRQFNIAADRFTNLVEPIIASRCVTCHECVEAPCQLKLSSYKGIVRGTSKQRILSNGSPTTPTRIKDANNVDEWRAKNFAKVVQDKNNAEGTALTKAEREQNQLASIMFQALQQGFSTNKIFDVNNLKSYYQKDEQVCPATIEEHNKFLADNPNAGMPLGCAKLTDGEYKTLIDWIADGAPGPTANAQIIREGTKNYTALQGWEAFLNTSTAENKLVARYLFEHFTYVHFYFEGSAGEFYELVRSSTSYPKNIIEIVTQTTDEPTNTSQFFYRFKKITDVLVKKTHIIYEANNEKLSKIKSMFFAASWVLPKQYKAKYSGNPFEDFQYIPAKSRAAFMLENSKLMVDQMIRGPVCVGRTATYAIRDHFWVLFLNPDADPTVVDQYLGNKDRLNWSAAMRIVDEPIDMSVFNISAYQKRLEITLQKIKPKGLGLNDIWKGVNATDDNALLTIYRHDESATVHAGWIGGYPKTLFFLSYANFERLFYTLVVKYKYWGNMFHKGNSWNIMRIIREEAESLAISLFPEQVRPNIEQEWAKGVAKYFIPTYYQGRPSQISINNLNNPLIDMIQQISKGFSDMQKHTGDDILNYYNDANKVAALTDFEKGLQNLAKHAPAAFESYLPPLTHIRYFNKSNKTYKVYTIIANDEFLNHDIPFYARKPLVHLAGQGDISVFPGFWGNYGFVYFEVTSENYEIFLQKIMQLKSLADFTNLKEQYGVRRNSEAFWKTADWMMTYAYEKTPLDNGIIDLSKYDRDDLMSFDTVQ